MIFISTLVCVLVCQHASALSFQTPRTRNHMISQNLPPKKSMRFQPSISQNHYQLRSMKSAIEMNTVWNERGNQHMKNTSPTCTTLFQSSTTADDYDESTKKASFLPILWRFTRPHTIIGSALAIPALHLYSLSSYSFLKANIGPITMSALYAMIPSLLMNLYITGLNQITDVEIDKVNKPDLVLASGELKESTAVKIVLAALVSSLIMGFKGLGGIYATQGLNVALWGSCILGTAYSLPPIRLKRFPQFAAFCVVAVRGAIINAGFYAHARAVLGGSSGFLNCLLEKRCLLSSLWFSGFGLVIALMKDVPDARGDELFNIRSFTVRIGQKNILKAMRRLLASLFFGVGLMFTKGVVSSLNGSNAVGLGTIISRCIVSVSSFWAAYSVREESKKVNDAEDPTQVYDYYMFLWKLFYVSYLILPFAR